MTQQSNILRRKLDQIQLASDEASSKSLRSFLDCVVADIAPEPKKLSLVIEDWQRERNDRVIPAAEYIAGFNNDYNGKLFFWEGFHKGCDKSNTIARIACWLLCYSKKSLKMYVAAKDGEQATVIYEAILKTAQLNPYIRKKLEFKRNLVTSKTNGSRLYILNSDAGGVAGINPDVIIADELSQWQSELFWDGLFGGAMKRSGKDDKGNVKGYCLVYVITNAGFQSSWQWGLREDAKINPLWSFYEGEVGRVYPGWISPEVMASVRRGMSEWEARRLLDNEWLSPTEAAEKFFSPSDIEACIGTPQIPTKNNKIFLGIDYGEKKDRTALSVVHMAEDGSVHVSDLTVWQGTVEQPTQLEDVEQWIQLQLGRYPEAIPVFDEHQTLYLIQKFEKQGKPYRRFAFRSGAGNLLMADNLRTLMKNKKIVFSIFTGLIGGSTLAHEFHSVIAKRKEYGTRIEHTSKTHDDRVVSVGIAALHCVQEAEPPTAVQKQPETVKEEDLVELWIKHQRTKGEFSDRRYDYEHAQRHGLFGLGEQEDIIDVQRTY